MLLSNSLSVQRAPTGSLRPAEGSVRRHPKKQLAKVRKSLEVFGQVTPILVTPDGEIIDLELVWQALRANGATHVDVIVIADKSPAEIKALRLMLNRSAMDAVWDDENLRNALQELIDLEFDLELTGFDAPEIAHHLTLDWPSAHVEDNGSQIPPVDVKAVSALGSIWALGDHRIGCGNATDHPFVSRVLAGRLAYVSFVDPPYNIAVHGFISGKGSHRNREFVKRAGELSREDYYALLHGSLSVLKLCSLPTALIYACIDWRHVMEMTVAGYACDMLSP
jgi:hypothetical protein